jgi:hypothetical protein
MRSRWQFRLSTLLLLTILVAALLKIARMDITLGIVIAFFSLIALICTAWSAAGEELTADDMAHRFLEIFALVFTVTWATGGALSLVPAGFPISLEAQMGWTAISLCIGLVVAIAVTVAIFR